jgi:hypothetical protein
VYIHIYIPGGRCAVIIASDGEASDGDISEAMRPLQTLPVSTRVSGLKLLVYQALSF